MYMHFLFGDFDLENVLLMSLFCPMLVSNVRRTLEWDRASTVEACSVEFLLIFDAGVLSAYQTPEHFTRIRNWRRNLRRQRGAY